LKNLLHAQFEQDETSVPAGLPPIPEDFAVPEELASRLKVAAELYSITEMKSCLGEVTQLGPGGQRFADHLLRMAENYDMDSILRYLEGAQREQALS